MPFNTVQGHSRQKEILQRAVRSDRIPGAYLFSGPSGVGKQLVARALIELLNCELEGEDSCGTCRSCRMLASGSHPDLFIPRRSGRQITKNPPADLSRASEGSGFLAEIIPKLKFAPIMGRWKVVLMDDAHELNETAANYLLKILEEPPPRTLFILVTAAENRLLPTIRSRCQRLRFAPLEPQVIEALIAQKTSLEQESAHRVAGLAFGSFGRALELADTGKAELIASWLTLVDRLHRMTSAERLSAIDEILTNQAAGDTEKLRLETFVEVLRAWVRIALESPGELGVQGSTRAEALLETYDLIHRAEKALAVNANPRILGDWLISRFGTTGNRETSV